MHLVSYNKIEIAKDAKFWIFAATMLSKYEKTCLKKTWMKLTQKDGYVQNFLLVFDKSPSHHDRIVGGQGARGSPPQGAHHLGEDKKSLRVDTYH